MKWSRDTPATKAEEYFEEVDTTLNGSKDAGEKASKEIDMEKEKGMNKETKKNTKKKNKDKKEEKKKEKEEDKDEYTDPMEYEETAPLSMCPPEPMEQAPSAEPTSTLLHCLVNEFHLNREDVEETFALANWPLNSPNGEQIMSLFWDKFESGIVKEVVKELHSQDTNNTGFNLGQDEATSDPIVKPERIGPEKTLAQELFVAPPGLLGPSPSTQPIASHSPVVIDLTDSLPASEVCHSLALYAYSILTE